MAATPAWRRHRGSRIGGDLAALAAYLGLAVHIGWALLSSPTARVLKGNWPDQILIEWFLSYAGRFWLGDFDLVTGRLNAPEGVNLMGNASHIAHGVLLAPVTWLWGAPTSFAVALAGNLAFSAFCWYLLFSRVLVSSRVAAFAGGLLAGFSPGMLSQSQSHLHISAQWLAPLLIWCTVVLWRTDRPLRWGALLGLLTAAQLFVGEEVLFLTVAATAVFAAAYAAGRRRELRARLPALCLGFGSAAAVAGALLAYPLTVQFAGRQHLTTAPFPADFFSADAVSYVLYSPLVLGGDPTADVLAPNRTELNTFLGATLIAVCAFTAVILWRRRPVVRALGLTGLVFVLFSFGPRLVVGGTDTGVPTPYQLLGHLPVIDAALPTRYALVVAPIAAALIALLVDAAEPRGLAAAIRLRLGGLRPGRDVARRTAALAAVAIALVPLWPRTLPTLDRPPLPDFIASGRWHDCVPPGGVLVPVPPPWPANPITMRWAAYANVAFATPEGFFLGPYGRDGATSVGTYSRPTAAIWREVWRTGNIPEIDDEDRDRAREDLAFWDADCVVLPPSGRRDELLAVTERLLGPGEAVDDVFIWRVGASW